MIASKMNFLPGHEITGHSEKTSPLAFNKFGDDPKI
jgi:hypothetical protein